MKKSNMCNIGWMGAVAWVLTAGALAQAPAGAPAGATGICKDGTYSTAAEEERRLCRAQGCADLVRRSRARQRLPLPPASQPPCRLLPRPRPNRLRCPHPCRRAPRRPTSLRRRRSSSPAEAAAQKPAAPGGGKGLVWVNTSSNVYHCSDDPFYGKTKAGSYMSEADAKAKGAHGERGKTCEGK